MTKLMELLPLIYNPQSTWVQVVTPLNHTVTRHEYIPTNNEKRASEKQEVKG